MVAAGDAAEHDDRYETEQFVHVGDEIAFQIAAATSAEKRGMLGYITSRKSDGNCYVDFRDGSSEEKANPPQPSMCRFMVHTANQYNMAKRLQKTKAALLSTKTEQQEHTTIARMRRAAFSEAEVNAAEMEMSIGAMVVFGNTYQLLNVASDRFLAVERTVAEEDTSAVKVALQDPAIRTKNAWFRIMPGFRARSVGEPVRFGDTIILQSAKLPSMSVACNAEETAEKTFALSEISKENADDNRREINAAARASNFKVVPIMKFYDVSRSHRGPKDEDERHVRGGGFIQCFQRQSQCYLYRAVVGDEDYPRLFRPEAEREDATPAPISRADLIWCLEVPKMEWSGSKVRHGRTRTAFSLRDAVSGRYLLEGKTGELEFGDGDDHADDAGRWFLAPLDEDTEEYAFEHTKFMLESAKSNKVLHSGEEDKEGLKEERTANSAGKMLKMSLLARHEADENDVFVFRTMNRLWLERFQEITDLLDVLHLFRGDMRNALKATEGKPREKAIQQLHATYLAPDFDGPKEPDPVDQDIYNGDVLDVLERLLYLLTPFSCEKDYLVRDGVVDVDVQDILYDVQLVSFILDMLTNQTDGLFRLKAQSELGDMQKNPENRYYRRAVLCSFRLLRMLCKGHSGNSELIAEERALSCVVEQLGYGFKAADTLTEVFRGHRKLIASVSETFINKLWGELTLKKRQSRYLEFVSVLLTDSSLGSAAPVKRNQDVFIKAIMQEENLEKLDWDPEWQSGDHKDEKFRFHYHFINVAALLCAGRHRESIDFFLKQTQFGFTYEAILLQIEDAESLPAVRSAFVKLMLAMFVHREPYERLDSNQKARFVPGAMDSVCLKGDTLSWYEDPVNPFLNIKNDKGELVKSPSDADPEFDKLKQSIVRIIEGVRKQGNAFKAGALDATMEDTLFLIDVVTLAESMLRFGMYDGTIIPRYVHRATRTKTYPDGVLKMGEVEIVYGNDENTCKAKDFGENSETRTLATSVLRLFDGTTEDSASRWEVNPENIKLMSLKHEVLRIVHTMFGIRSSSRITALFELVFNKTPDTGADTFENPLTDATVEGTSSANLFDYEAKCKSLFEKESTVERAMALFDSLKVFNEQPTKNKENKAYATKAVLVEMLLDALQYRDRDLCFSSFKALVSLIAQDFYFSKTLSAMMTVSSPEDAQLFLEIQAQISNYRRLRKWVHQDNERKECIEAARGLRDILESGGTERQRKAQDLMRHLKLKKALKAVLTIRLDNDDFEPLLVESLELTSVFCDCNAANQRIIASVLDQVILPLIWLDSNGQMPYVRAGVKVLTAVVNENTTLCSRYAKRFVEIAEAAARKLETASKGTGRVVELLHLLETLLMDPEGHTIQSAQILVCKGAKVSTELMDTTGDLDEMHRSDVIKMAFEPEGENAECKEHLKYYANCLRVLAVCARGKNTIERLMELCSEQHCPQKLDNNDEVIALKTATLMYYREVFVDTNSEHLVRMLRRAKNGIWAVRVDTEGSTQRKRKPVGPSLAKDLERLRDETKLSIICREYLIEEVVKWFIQYTQQAKYSQLTEDERKVCTETFESVKETVNTVLKGKFPLVETGEPYTNADGRYREVQLLLMLQKIAEEFCNEEVCNEESIIVPDKPISMRQRATPTAKDIKWKCFVEMFTKKTAVQKIRGTEREAGRGLLEVAQEVWGISKTTRQRYCAHLVVTLEDLLAKMVATEPTPDDCDNVLMVVDVIRAIPYIVTIFDKRKQIHVMGGEESASARNTDDDDKADKAAWDDAFERYLHVKPLVGLHSHTLMQAQLILVKQGWALLCWKFLAQPTLKACHLAMLRLLLAITGGCNKDTKDELLRQVSDTKICKTEIMARSCRRMLRLGIEDLKVQRKAILRRTVQGLSLQRHQQRGVGPTTPADTRNVKETTGSKSSNLQGRLNKLKLQMRLAAVAAMTHIDVDQEAMENGHALELLEVMDNLAEDHSGFQDYIARQPSHDDSLDLILDIVRFIDHVERDLKIVIVDAEYNASSPIPHELIRARDIKTLARAKIAFKLLSDLAAGPNRYNQLAIAKTKVFSVVNRVFAASTYRVINNPQAPTKQQEDAQDDGSDGDLDLDVEEVTKEAERFTEPEQQQQVTKGKTRRGGRKTIMQSGRKNVWQDLAEQDLALSPTSAINELITDFLLALLMGSVNSMEQVVFRLLSSIEWPLVIDHMKALKFALTQSDKFLIKRTKSQASTEVAKVEEQLKSLDVSWTQASKEYERNQNRLFAVKERLLQDGCRFTTIVQKVRSFRYAPSDNARLEPLVPLLNDKETMTFFLQRLCEVEIVHDTSNELLMYYFPAPRERLDTRMYSQLQKDVEKAMDAAPRADPNDKLAAWVDGMMPALYEIKDRDPRESYLSLRTLYKLTETYDPRLILSIVLTGICVIALDRTSEMSTMDQKTFGRVKALYTPFFALGMVHVVATMISIYAFIIIRLPVIKYMRLRHKRLQLIAQEDTHKSITDTAEEGLRDFKKQSIFISGLKPSFSPDQLQSYMNNFGVVASLRTLPGCGWAVVAYTTKRSADEALKHIRQGKLNDLCEGYDEIDSDEDKSCWCCRRSSRQRRIGHVVAHGLHGSAEVDPQSERLVLFDVNEPHNERFARDMVLDMQSQDFTYLYQVVTSFQWFLDHRLGMQGAIPVQTLYALKDDPEVLEVLLDLAFSLTGMFMPLAFSFHVSKIRKIPAAKIVVLSITRNWRRLFTVVLLALFMMYVFAVVALLWFFDAHTDENVQNKNIWISAGESNGEGEPELILEEAGGPCANLLSCFVSYTFAGFVQDGLTYWLEPVRFPESIGDLMTNDSARILFEVLFMFVTSSFVVSIITGIICDTFGELRVEQDDAQEYRATNCFVTNLSYTAVPPEKTTNHMQYAYLILHLTRKDPAAFTKLERQIWQKIVDGRIDWMPNGRCFTLEYKSTASAQVLPRLAAIETQVEQMQSDTSERLTRMEELLLEMHRSRKDATASS